MGILRQEYWSGLACPPPGESSQPRDQTQVSCIAGGFFTIWATREAQEAYSFSRGSFRPRNQTRVSCIAGGFFTFWATRKAHFFNQISQNCKCCTSGTFSMSLSYGKKMEENRNAGHPNTSYLGVLNTLLIRTTFYYSKCGNQDFPGGPVVKTSGSKWGHERNPKLGN